MSLTYNQLSSVTQKKFIPKLYDNVFDSNPLTMRLKKKSYKKLDGGESVMVPLNYAQVTSTAWYSGSDTLSTSDNEVMTAAEYTWKQLHAAVAVTRADELKNSGDSQILNFVKEKVKIAERTMISQLGTGIYSAGTNTKSIVGLRVIVGTSNTVGGISQTDYSWWQAQVDSSTTTLSIAKMQERFNLCTVDNQSPSVIPTTRTLYNSYYALLQPAQRFTDSETAKGGFSNLLFNGAPVIADSYCPSGYMFFLNEDSLILGAHKDEDMRFEPFSKPVNQNVQIGHVQWMGIFGSSNNRLHGAMTALTA